MWDALSGVKSALCFAFFAGHLRPESHWTHEHILLSVFLRLPHPGGPGSCIYFPQEQGCPVIPSLCFFYGPKDDGEVVSLTHRPQFASRRIPGTLVLCWSLSQPQDRSAAARTLAVNTTKYRPIKCCYLHCFHSVTATCFGPCFGPSSYGLTKSHVEVF
jgi:hypothetical protein